MKPLKLSPLRPIDKTLDSVTPYRLVLYCLTAIVGWAVIASFFHELPFKWYEIVLASAWLLAICFSGGRALARWLNIPNNKESDFITGLILALILSSTGSADNFIVLGTAAVAATVSKYALTIGRRHIFNPAAVGAFTAGVFFSSYASWWVGARVMVPVVLICGVLIVRKMKRLGVVGIFLVIYLLKVAFSLSGYSASIIFHDLWLSLSLTPVIFFATVMLIEPLTSPASLPKSLPYIGLVGVLFSYSQFHFSPEEALLAGNVLAYLLSPYKRLSLQLIGRKKEAEGIYSYIFSGKKKFKFQAGQYMEWTLPINQSDSRGNRRYLTIASSPTEQNFIITLKVPARPSRFKQKLASLKSGETILASRLAGSFVLPKDKDVKLAFMAGGVGITPFRSIIKYLLDSRQQRSIVLLYSANAPAEFAFTNIFKQAAAIGLKTIYNVTGTTPATSWKGYHGPIDKNLISSAIPDYKDRLFYVSGSYGFVEAAKSSLFGLGLNRKQVITDYFPGYG